MKKTIECILLAAIVISAFGACKKESTAANANDFIEFKIDGQYYRMEEQQIAPGNSNFIIGAASHGGPVSGKYFLQIAFAHSTSDEGIGFNLSDNVRITKPHYDISLANGEIISYIMPGGNQYMISATSNGSVDFSKIDTTLGKTVEGTFQVNGLVLQDDNGDELSSGHILTEGKFRTKVK